MTNKKNKNMIKKSILLILIICASCSFETPTAFTEVALQENVFSLNNKKSTFKEVIANHKGKKILVDFWASWCRDCIVGMPKVKALQKEFPEVAFLFLSVDENKRSWKKVVQRLQLKGNHYNLPKGMKNGELVDFVGLGWIPRYMVIDEHGKIVLFKATDASDKNIIEALKKQ